MEISAVNAEIKNCQILPPYEGMDSYRIMIPPYESAAILGLRLNYSSGAFNIKFEARIQVRGPQLPYQSMNMGARFENYLKFNISNDSPSNNALRTEEYKFIKRDIAKKLPKFNSTIFVGKESLKQSMMMKQEITPEILVKKYPNEFNILFENCKKDITPDIQKKWTILKSPEGVYIGQINISNGELEGRAVFFWKIGIKYIGYFSKNELNGKGFLIDKNNKLVFKGNFSCNKRNGLGLLKYGNGDYYEGNFTDNKLEGNGEYHFSNGDVWEGVFQKNMKNGIGVMTKKNGELFLTQYENDNFIGEIKLHSEEKTFIENLRQKDRKLILEQRQLNESDRQNIIYMKNNASMAAFDLYKKKRNLTASIIVYK